MQQHLAVDARQEDVPELPAYGHGHVVLRQEINLQKLYYRPVVEVSRAQGAIAQDFNLFGFAPAGRVGVLRREVLRKFEMVLYVLNNVLVWVSVHKMHEQWLLSL